MIEKYKVKDYAQMFPDKFKSMLKSMTLPLWVKIDIVTDPNYYVAIHDGVAEIGYLTDEWTLE